MIQGQARWLQKLSDEGLRPSIDFGYQYGLLSLSLSRLWFRLRRDSPVPPLAKNAISQRDSLRPSGVRRGKMNGMARFHGQDRLDWARAEKSAETCPRDRRGVRDALLECELSSMHGPSFESRLKWCSTALHPTIPVQIYRS